MKPKTKIIFDTDIGSDCDDAGALAMLHRLCDAGECELLAVSACYDSPYVAGCIDAINRYYGHVVPVGINYGHPPAEFGKYGKILCEEFESSYPVSVYKTDKGACDTCELLRRTLANAEDNSVTIVAAGSMASLARLVQSPPDEISSFSGAELISKKVLRTVAMGGRFFGTWPMPLMDGDTPKTWEWNIRADIPSAQAVCRLWPGELIFSSTEIGQWCVTMNGYAQNAPADDPVRRAYEIHSVGRRRGRESWDHTATLYAVRPDAGYWNLHPWGRIDVDDEGVTTWYADTNCKHSYLLPREDYDTIRQVIDNIVMPNIIKNK